jgi:hypothetical protein
MVIGLLAMLCAATPPGASNRVCASVGTGASASTAKRNRPAATGDVMQWAKESHDLAGTTAYDGLSNGDDLEDDYISKASPVVQNQLLRAGVRLAKVLDENF